MGNPSYNCVFGGLRLWRRFMPGPRTRVAVHIMMCYEGAEETHRADNTWMQIGFSLKRSVCLPQFQFQLLLKT